MRAGNSSVLSFHRSRKDSVDRASIASRHDVESVNQVRTNLLQDGIDSIGQLPLRIVFFKPSDVANPPDMIAGSFRCLIGTKDALRP